MLHVEQMCLHKINFKAHEVRNNYFQSILSRLPTDITNMSINLGISTYLRYKEQRTLVT